jgi:hypothetical protein
VFDVDATVLVTTTGIVVEDVVEDVVVDIVTV